MTRNLQTKVIDVTIAAERDLDNAASIGVGTTIVGYEVLERQANGIPKKVRVYYY